ncbi:terminase TerL endonuclease subunit [Hoeflea sp.]|uniref:terminase TerL endonuclease subunit n=1 Tax=Hoeflea sp. TaxID=1940281 RepID=UPI003A8F46FB
MAGVHRAHIDVIINRAKPLEVLFSERRKGRRWFSAKDIAVLRIAHELGRAGRLWNTAIAQAFTHLEHPPPRDAILIIPVMSVSHTTGRVLTGLPDPVQDTAKRISYRKHDVTYEALSSDAKNAHGRTDVCAFWDEGHAETKDDLLEAIETGLNKSANTLLLSASTAGIGRTGPFWTKYEHAKKVTDGRVLDETFLPVLFEAPADVDFRDEEWLFATNPGLAHGYPNLKKLRRYIERCEHSPAERESFKRLHLSVYLDGAANPEWDLAIWDEGHGEIDLDGLAGRKAWLAVDLSKRIDLSAVVATIELDDERYAVHCMGFGSARAGCSVDRCACQSQGSRHRFRQDCEVRQGHRA